jgi:DNA-binding PadR family transcriptional regulator
MSNRKLTPTSYLVLGAVAFLVRATSYDLKSFVQLSVSHFWSFPHSQLYAEPERLVQMGLLSDRRESGGRHRRIYSITDEGRRELEAWLADPDTAPFELRDMGVLKLFFGNLAQAEDVLRLAERQVERAKEQLEEYAAIEERFKDVTGLDYQLATLQCGIAVERAVLAFWEQVAKDPPRRP